MSDDYLVSTSLWIDKCSLYCKLKRFDDALTLTNKRTKVAPTDSNAVSSQAWLLWQMKKTNEALTAVDKAIKLADDEVPYFLHLKACILADMSLFNEAMNLLLHEMELQAASKESINIDTLKLSTQWLLKCHPVPLLGLKMAAAFLGALLVQKGHTVEAKNLLKTLLSLEWSHALQSAETDDRELLLALTIIKKACHHLGHKIKVFPQIEKISDIIDEPSHAPAVFESILSHMLQTEWSNIPQKRKPTKSPPKSKKQGLA